MKFSILIYFLIICGSSFVASFSWGTCDPATQHNSSITVYSIDVSSNDPETVYITAKWAIATNITAPVQAEVRMMKKYFWGWTLIPCMDYVGSCTYDDVCDLNPYKDEPCPPQLTAIGLPCKCPIPEGEYAVEKFPVSLNIFPKWLEKGKYRFKFTLSQKEVQLMCLIMYISL